MNLREQNKLPHAFKDASLHCPLIFQVVVYEIMALWDLLAQVQDAMRYWGLVVVDSFKYYENDSIQR